MARTNRKDVPPPAPSVDALDDLNLDDMFEGGDDSLFDGLDIDLDGMGEISGALDDKKDDKTLPPMDFSLGQSPEELVAEELASSSKRRKTKRKSKTPLSFIEDEEPSSPSKKKRRSTKSTKKSKSKSKQKEEPPSPAESKSKSKTKTSSTMPPPLPRGMSGGPGMVAAAGQFGGRTQKRGTFTFPLSRSSSDKSKTKTKVSGSRPPSNVVPPSTGAGAKAKGRSSVAGASTRGSFVKQQEEILTDTAQESTFCGLQPSRTLFYPFMPSLPQEPGMKKCHKLYTSLDSINSTMNTSANSASAAPNALLSNATAENEALFRLLFSHNEHHCGPSDSSSSQMLRRAAVASSISAARQTLSQIDASRLVSDLHSVCVLLKRQYDFINQSVENMDHWCRDHFTELDHAAVFGSPTEASISTKKRKSGVESPANLGIRLGKNLSGLSGAVLRVKVSCTGYKEPKMSAVLVAQIPGVLGAKPPIPLPVRPSIVAGTVEKTGASKKTTSKTASKKRKLTSSSSVTVKAMDHVPPIPAVVAPVIEEVVSYANLKPSERRERIVDAVSQQARRLEVKYVGATEGRHLSLLRQEAELQKVVEDDELLMVNTSTLWKWIERSAYFANYTEDDVKQILHFAWQPEISDPGALNQDVPPVHVATRSLENASEELNGKRKEDKTSKTSVNSLFDRLQSLLVDEGSGDETESDSDDESSFDDRSGERKELNDSAPYSSSNYLKDDIFDYSELNLEERTYIQLRSIGLVDSPFLPSSHPVLIEDDDSLSDSSGENKSSNVALALANGEKTPPARSDNDLDEVLQAMQRDLGQLHRLNNSRTALLQSAATAHLSAMQQAKKKEDGHSQLIAKFNQLLKKQKETKRSARQKTVKKDEDWVPW